jgi:hypothetical protein
MLQKHYAHVCNAASADLIHVLCSSHLCQQQLLCYQGLVVLLATLRNSMHLTVWVVNMCHEQSQVAARAFDLLQFTVKVQQASKLLTSDPSL